ncbi:MAG TPA: ABC-type transport auxiliary lipoprotein family protein, partial [Rhodopila sp.]|uniref:ABC-type transport auxiliary lipoprotein family protein n=1 Tax=Rhodopila sp. TaxID=2480087 RepID=UPI002C34F304
VTTDTPVKSPLRQVLVDVATFEPRADGTIVLSAQWRLTDGSGDRQLAGEAVTLTGQAADMSDPAIVAGMSKVVDQLALRIAQGIRNAGEPPTRRGKGQWGKGQWGKGQWDKGQWGKGRSAGR